MTGNPFSFNSRDPREEKDDPAWALLAKSPLLVPDPWFTVRTLARCRLTESTETRGLVLHRVWRWAMAGGLSVCLVMVLVTRHHHASSPSRAADQKGVQEAFEIMASIKPDSDTPPSDSSSWQDSSL